MLTPWVCSETERWIRLNHKPTTCPSPEVYQLMKAEAFEPNAEVEQTLEQRVEALEAELEAINARL